MFTFLDLPDFVFRALLSLGDGSDGDLEIFADVRLVSPWEGGDTCIFLLGHYVSRVAMLGMVGMFEFFGSSDELLAKAPKAAEIRATLDLVDRADDLANGIDGVGDHGAASGVGNFGCVRWSTRGSTVCGSECTSRLK